MHSTEAHPGSLKVSDKVSHRSGDRLGRSSAVAIGVLVVSTLVVLMNEMALGVALPHLMDDLGVTASTGQWLTTGYMLTMAVVIPTTAFLMQRFRLRAFFIAAMATFSVGTLIAASAPGFEMLFAGRIIQAAGTAVMMPLLLSTTMILVPPARQGQIMGVVTVVIGGAPAFAPALSGLVVDQLGWRWLFIIILPIALVCLAMGARMIRVVTDTRTVKLDALSVALSALGFAALVYGLSTFGESAEGATPVAPWIPLTLGVVVIGLFVLRQTALQRTDNALLDMRAFASKAFTASAAIMAFITMTAFGVILVMPLILQESLGLSTLQAGLFMAPGGAAIAIVSLIVGRCYDRVGPRPFVISGAVVVSASLWFMSTLGPGTSVWVYLAAHLVMCTGQSFVWTPAMATALGSLRAALIPHGSAIMNTIQQLAGAAGTAILISVLVASAATREQDGADTSTATAEGGQVAFMVGGVITLFAVVASLFITRPVSSATELTRLPEDAAPVAEAPVGADKPTVE
ncbi:MDR family MFS transporter [Nocardia sp. 348MFTsu5.1]|uniref:MDR family MFS transporter n=1 Tax=Nocardia sp. 348MFTsu5.1 TaxID=1172185 RepID=UPI00039E9C2F|nr:MDR family MFS transporter [Nocardia sp. 348MFTsu5.1]